MGRGVGRRRASSGVITPPRIRHGGPGRPGLRMGRVRRPRRFRVIHERGRFFHWLLDIPIHAAESGKAAGHIFELRERQVLITHGLLAGGWIAHDPQGVTQDLRIVEYVL